MNLGSLILKFESGWLQGRQINKRHPRICDGDWKCNGIGSNPRAKGYNSRSRPYPSRPSLTAQLMNNPYGYCGRILDIRASVQALSFRGVFFPTKRRRRILLVGRVYQRREEKSIRASRKNAMIGIGVPETTEHVGMVIPGGFVYQHYLGLYSKRCERHFLNLQRIEANPPGLS